MNVKKTEVLVFGGQLSARKEGGQSITYGPAKQQLKEVSSFKFLGMHLSETGKMKHTMGERGAPFAAALHRAGRMAARVRLSRHVPTRLRLAAVYAVIVAYYGDVV